MDITKHYQEVQEKLAIERLERRARLAKWLTGMFSNGLSGIGIATGGAMLAPKEINFDEGVYRLLGMFAIGFGLSCISYFQKSPLYNALYEPTNTAITTITTTKPEINEQ